jgi:hypothetical protein
VHGDGNLLRQELGLAADTGAPPRPPSGDESHEVVFVRVGPVTGRVEAFNHATVNGETLGEVVTGLVDWMVERDVFVDLAAEESPSPWEAVYQNIWTGRMVGDDGPQSGENVGTYQFTLAVYLLSENPDFNWWRVDLASISNIQNYVKSTKHCGWWTYSMASFVDLHQGAMFWDYMPDTTVANHSQTFTIGADISVRPGVSAQYSQSYGTSDVTITVHANSVDERITWDTSLSGCHDYFWYPFYKGASNAAKTSFKVAPSLIARVPKGENFSFSTYRPLSLDFTQIFTRIDKFEFDAFGSLKWNPSTGLVSLRVGFECDSTTCTAQGP